MKMIAVLTGDIVNSASYPEVPWMEQLKVYFSTFGTSPGEWEIFRGDEFQLKVPVSDALQAAVHIKALIRSNAGLDVRIAIGIGTENRVAERISESNGTAYQRSGRTFSQLKKKRSNLRIATGNSEFDTTWNLILALALNFMDHWSSVSAEITVLSLAHPNRSQEALARQLNIKQSAISQRRKRARWKLLKAMLDQYSRQIANLTA